MATRGEKAVNNAVTYGAAGSVVGPWGTAAGAGYGLLKGLFSGDDPSAPAPPAPADPQYVSMSQADYADPNAYRVDPSSQLMGSYRQDLEPLWKSDEVASAAESEYQDAFAAIARQASQEFPGGGSEQSDRIRELVAANPQAQALKDRALGLRQNDMEQRTAYNQNKDKLALLHMGDAASQQGAQQGDFASAGARGMADQNNTRNMQLGQANNLLYNDQSGAGQDKLVGRLYDDMNGGQPSVAQIQLNQGAQSALRQQSALAASASPMNAAFAQKQAAMQSAGVMGNLDQQQALLRAQEYATARGQLGDTLNQQHQQYYLGQQTAAGINKDSRGQDLSALSYDYNNELQNAQLRASQQTQNNANQQYYVGQYLGQQNQTQQNNLRGYEFNANLKNSRDLANLNASVGAGSNTNGYGSNVNGANNTAIAQQKQDDSHMGAYISAGGQGAAAYQQFNKPSPTPAANGYDPNAGIYRSNPYGDD